MRPASLAAILVISAGVADSSAGLATPSPLTLSQIPAPSIIQPLPPPPGAAYQEDAYTLGAGDQIRIDIFRIERYGGESTVLVDGTLNLPVVGSVSVQGMTLEQAAEAVAQKYSRILRQPRVTISLIQPRPVKVGIAGEIQQPGLYTLDRQGQLPSLAQVLEAAGGIRQSADLRQVQVRRPQASGAETVITVDLWQFLQTGDQRYDLTLRDGDSVFVPAAAVVNREEASQLAAASFAADETLPINIAVVGEVFRPGPHTVTGSTRTAQEAGVAGGVNQLGTSPTVTRAIQVAGGITPTADIRQIQIRRKTRTGTEQSFSVDLWQLLQGDLSQDAILQEGDTIVVPTATAIDPSEAPQIAAASFSPDSIKVNVVGEVVRPGVVEVPPNTPFNQALLAAGGANNRANTNAVQLIRLNPDGSVSRQEIDVDFTSGINSDTNPALRNNDVIVVGRSGIASLSDILSTAADPLTRFFTLFSVPLNFFRLF